MTTAIAKSGYSAPQIRTIKNTVASDTDDEEFDLFMEACMSYKLDPFRKQIHAVVYNKSKPKPIRKMSIIVSRDGLRVLAQRCKDYRPASEKAELEIDESLKGPTNPLGIVSCTVKLWKQDNQGEWYPVIGEAFWDEFAPISAVWEYDPQSGKNKPTDKMEVSGTWKKMPRIMITKCAESQALRAGWPDQFGNIYSEEEMDRMGVEESATERLQEFERQERQERLGGPGLMMVFDDSMKLEKVAMGQVYDRCAEFLRSAEPVEAMKFQTRNEAALREFWGHDSAAALELKKIIDKKAGEFNPKSEEQ